MHNSDQSGEGLRYGNAATPMVGRQAQAAATPIPSEISPAGLRGLLTRAATLPLLLMACLAGVLFWQLTNLRTITQWVEHSDQVLAQTRELERLTIDMETGVRGFLITGNDEFLEPYQKASGLLGNAFTALAQLLQNEPVQRARLEQLRVDQQQWIVFAQQAIELRRTNGNYQDYTLNLRGKQIMDGLRARYTALANAEELLRMARARTEQQTTLVVASSAIGLTMLLGGLLAFLSRRQLVKLSRNYGQALNLTRAQAEDIRQQEQRYRTLAEAMPQIVWATDAQGAHTYFNQRWYDYTGFDARQSLGFGFADALHPDDHARTLAKWRSAWHDGADYTIEYRFRRHDGSYHWFVGRAVPVRDDSGAIIEWVGTCTDIDETRRAGEVQRFLAEATTLLASSLDYETTLARVAQLAVPQLGDWCAVDVLDEQGALKRLGVAHIDPYKVVLAHELQQRYPPDMNAPSGVPAVLRSGQPELIAEIPDALLVERIVDPELLALMRSLGLTSSMVVPLVARGRTLGAITLVAAESGRRYGQSDLELAQDLARRAAVAVDNARLYRELSQFRATLDQTRDAVFIFDAQSLRFTYMNQGALDQSGYSRDELLAMRHLDLLPEYDEQRYSALLAPLLAGEQVSHTFETLQWHKQGHTIPVEIALQYVAPQRPEQPGSFVAIVRDISERRRTEQALRERAEELTRLTQLLERRNRELDQFAYVTSHDLKAPLRGIANLSQWIEEDLGEHVTDEIRRQLELLRGRVHRMEALIEGILQYSRVGRVHGSLERVDVGALLAETIDLLASPAGFTVEVQPPMPTLNAERLPLQQVFHNLIGNAIKHHNRPDGHIRVAARDQGHSYEFTVSDDGPGIAPQYHTKVFTIFTTLVARDKVEGSGLGLSLVKKIVESQGGSVTLESSEGAGATFRFTWPKETGG